MTPLALLGDTEPRASCAGLRPSRRKTRPRPGHGRRVDEVTFNGLKLLTSPRRVMTPRATSEQLVGAAKAHVGAGASRVVDVGTGSGAIAIGIAVACPHAEVWATDTSARAVALARANIRRHRLSDRVHVLQGDLLAPVAGRFDVIAANLPYLPASAAADHPDLDDEPFDAVFAAGDGLDSYRRLVDASERRLTEGGILLLQLDRRVVKAGRSELPKLRAELSAWRPAALPGAALDELTAKAA